MEVYFGGSCTSDFIRHFSLQQQQKQDGRQMENVYFGGIWPFLVQKCFKLEIVLFKVIEYTGISRKTVKILRKNQNFEFFDGF